MMRLSGLTLQADDAGDGRAARRAIRLIGFLLLVTVIVGRAWDAWWHITYPFDGFWSPPHVFVYGMTTLVGLLTARLAFTPGLRRQFGPGFAVPRVPFEVPGPLFLLGGGLVALGVAGMLLDNLWHTAFGLNETGWSLPHAMIGTSLAVVTCGYIACNYALRGPFGRGTALLYGFLLVAVFQVVLGPLGQNSSPTAVEAVARIPVLAAQPEAQARFFLCVSNNLTRSNPAVVLLGPLWLGLGLAAARGIGGRWWAVLAVAAVWTLLALDSDSRGARWLDQFGPVSGDPTSWMPLPLLPAALVWAAARGLGRSDDTAWALAGLAFGLLAASGWRMGPMAWALLPLAAPAAIAGARLGGAVALTVLEPRRARSWALLLALALVAPAVTGGVDLYLRLQK